MAEHSQSPDAARRLQVLLGARYDQPFAWGARDCFLWAADAAHAVTGRDPASDLRGQYTNALGAFRLLRRLGGWPGLLASRWGQPVPQAEAMDGDALLLSADACDGAGSRWGGLGVRLFGWAVAQGDVGLVIVPGKHVRGAWRAR